MMIARLRFATLLVGTVLLASCTTALAQHAVRDDFPNGKGRGELFEHFRQAEWDASNFAPPEAMNARRDRCFGMFIHRGGMLGVEYGFAASVSLDSHPVKIREMAQRAGIELTAFCAHVNLLDPPAPDIYGTNEIIKAIRLAALLGIKDVITTEGDPKTEFGEHLTRGEQIFAMVEKLRSPVHWAAELGVKLLLEPHGRVTDTIDGMAAVLEKLGHPETVGICLDTGNAWLGGAEPLGYVKTFGKRIGHVHWKDMPKEMEAQRGKQFGCGMAVIPLGDGVVGIPAIVKALKQSGFDGATTLEIFGADNVKFSAQRLAKWWAE